MAVVFNIPKGKTLSCKEVGGKAGNPKGARVVGSIMHLNYDNNIPCHRVVKSNSRVGAYNRGRSEKIRKLEEEGVIIEKGEILK